MAILTLRLVKGVPLTNAEVDGNFSNLNISKVEIGRDLSGNISYPVVSGIQGRDVSSTAPSDAQVLKWSTAGNAWAPASISYDTLNNPPVANIILTGDVTGSANAVLTANSTIITISATTIQANSVALGTDTTGDYVANVLAGTGIVVAGQGGETASPTVALDVSGVTANTYGGSSKVPVLTIDQYGRVTGAANVNVAGVTSFAASGNSFTISTADGGSFTANIQANSVALGTDTTGDYVANVLAGTGIVLSGQGGETATPTVSLDASGVTANTYGGSSKVPVLTIDQYGRVTSAANVNVAGVTSFAASGNSFTISTADGGSFTANIQQDSVRLGPDTTGNFVSTVTVGSGLTVSGTADEGNVVTVAHLDTSAVANVTSDNSDGTVIQDVSFGFDDFGHVTSASVSTVNLDNRFLQLSTGTLQTITGPVNFEQNVTFTGNVTTIAANNLVITDNFIYLNNGNAEINVDFGFVGNYNDGVYQHAGFFRDASDGGTWKVFEGYLPEPDAAVDIDTSNASFRLANLAVNKLTASDLVTGNIVPSANLVYNLGSPTNRFKDLYLSGNTINLGGAVLSSSGDSVAISAIDNTPIGETTRSTGKFTTVDANVITGNVYAGIIKTTVGTCNFFVGTDACAITATGCHNVFIGVNAGRYTTFGKYNFFAGKCAGFCNTTGCSNTFFGRYAGRSNTTGSNNIFFGSNAGRLNTTGNSNVFFGNSAGQNNTTGGYNFFFGVSAGQSNTTGTGNIIFGLSAGTYNTIGSHNTFIGRCAGNKNTTGCHNIFIGCTAGCSNTLGCNNFFAGHYAGRYNTTGDNNNFFGRCAGYYNTTGCNNTFIGAYAGNKNTIGCNNTFIGLNAGYRNTTGSYNFFTGQSAGFCNTTGRYNTFFGRCSGRFNTEGECNTFIGLFAGYCNTTGTNNIFIGPRAGFFNTIGTQNTYIGECAGFNGTSACHVIAIGSRAGACNTTGCRNVYLGPNSGGNVLTGNDNIIFGCITANVGLTASSSNVFVVATGGVERLKVDTGNLSVEAGAGNIVASQGFLNNLVVKNVSEYVANTATFSTTTESTLFEFSKDVYSSGKFTITGKQGSNVQISEMLVAQDGTTAAATEYGVVKTSNVTVFTGNVDISNSNIRIRVIGGSAISTKYTLAGTLLVL